MAGVPPLFNEDDFPPVEKKLTSWSSHCFRRQIFDSSSSSSCSGSGSGFSLSSPGESDLGSTESESDQDDEYTAELTRQMAHYMLQDDECSRNNEKATNLVGGRQPTAWRSQEDVKMVGNFQNLKINGDDNMFNYQIRDNSLAAASLSPTSILRNPDGLRSDIQSKQALIDEQIRAIKKNKFKDDMITREKQEDCSGWGSRPIGYKQTEPNKQVRQIQSKATAVSWTNNSNNLHGQQMRAAFLSETAGSKGGSSGTGVFLPRGVGIPSEPRKKPGCSTVLIPARVVQALKLHFDRVGVPSGSNAATVSLLQNADGITGDGNYRLQIQEKSQSRTAPATNHHDPEISCLPQEWTY